MSKAYQCDRCDDFDEGHPNRIKVKEYASVLLMGWGDEDTVHKLELCDECEESLKALLVDWRDVDDDAPSAINESIPQSVKNHD